MSDNDSASDFEEPKVKKYKCSDKRKGKMFNTKWLEDKNFKNWLKPIKQNDMKCLCKVCNKELMCGKSELLKHAEGKKHLANMRSVALTPSISSVFTDKSQIELDKNIKQAEIKLSVFFAEHNVATHVVDHLIPLLKDSFPDSKISKKMQLGRTKCSHIIKNVLGKSETENLVVYLRKNKFSILVDESTDIATKKSLCILVRYTKELKLQTQLLELLTIDAADRSAVNLYRQFKDCLQSHNIPVTNIIGVASDGASVMIGKNNSFFTCLKSDVPDALLIRCVCHSAAIIASSACEQLPRTPEELIRNIYNYISGSAKRSSVLQEIQEFMKIEQTKILNVSATRWLSRHASITRIL
jgi:hypothetical protein